MQIARKSALLLLRGYKFVISPWLPASCRYVPTCSEYAMEAVERFGVLRGSVMAAGRILRCHPFGKSGYDPVVRGGEPVGDQNGKRCASEFHQHGCRAN
jgi:putative membrane protein insertion efficiency factor